MTWKTIEQKREYQRKWIAEKRAREKEKKDIIKCPTCNGEMYDIYSGTKVCRVCCTEVKEGEQK